MENPASRGTEASAEVLAERRKMRSSKINEQRFEHLTKVVVICPRVAVTNRVGCKFGRKFRFAADRRYTPMLAARQLFCQTCRPPHDGYLHGVSSVEARQSLKHATFLPLCDLRRRPHPHAWLEPPTGVRG